jgi:hypothetical protein
MPSTVEVTRALVAVSLTRSWASRQTAALVDSAGTMARVIGELSVISQRVAYGVGTIKNVARVVADVEPTRSRRAMPGS